MEQIIEEYVIEKETFIKEYYNDFKSLDNPLNNNIKLFNCNFTGNNINILSDEKYIQYSDGYIYKWDIFEEFINYLYSIYESVNISLIDNESKYVLNISYNKQNLLLTFDKNFKKSFHSYIEHPYHKDLAKFLIYPIYKDIFDLRPYIKPSNLKHIKKYFSHGDIVYTGDNHYILKNIKENSKKWKLCDYSDEYDDHIFIPYEYIQSRTYSYYMNQTKYFDIAPLSLDILNNEEYDFHNNEVKCNLDDFSDNNNESKFYLDNPNNEENNLDINESPDIVSSNFGELTIKDNKLHVHLTKDNTMPLQNNDIAPHFIKSKGYTYYYIIAQEYKYNLNVLISPFEVLNLNTLKIKNLNV